MSRTILLAEIRAGITSYDPRGVWAMSGACPSSIWGVAYFMGDDYGPNCNTPLADDIISCSQAWTDFGGGPAVAEMGMACSNGNWPNWQQTARSLHEGGVYVSLADGSVQWLSDNVNSSPDTYENPSVWAMLFSSGDSQTVPESTFE
jgi:hypothetical protein